jgi:hypothetical protein
VIGAVVFWGKVVIRRDGSTGQITGAKAEYARILALLRPYSDLPDLSYHCDYYAVPALSGVEMVKVLPEFGDLSWGSSIPPDKFCKEESLLVFLGRMISNF